MIAGQLKICCHIIDYDFDLDDDFPANDLLIDQIEYEISKKIELEICKNINNGILSLYILNNEDVIKINGNWEIRK